MSDFSNENRKLDTHKASFELLIKTQDLNIHPLSLPDTGVPYLKCFLHERSSKLAL
ncbi:MAG: hypothetical protein GY749_42140 [Desulfobacteraceae bacterium]|nr:hypothetical protein [Desulfobacteraceae bacterium]